MGISTAKRAILIAGPTASGKSALALALAERHGGVVVNADSMQVYADLAILTARPTPDEMAGIPHRLFGHVDAADAYSVGRWIFDVRTVLAEIAEAGRLPVIVGGTGLYLKALTEGLSDMPAIPTAVRARLRHEMSYLRPQDLHARLAAVDPVMAGRLRPTDPQRMLRALEVIEATGQSLLAFQERRAPALLPAGSFAGIFVHVPRADLNVRIDRRFDLMMAGGALDEVAALGRRHLDSALPAMRALGVPQLLHAMANPERLGTAIAEAKLASRRYAKRQLTFARHQLPGLSWTTAADALAAAERQMA